MRHTLTLCALLAIACSSLAQTADNDPTFNITDQGFGAGDGVGPPPGTITTGIGVRTCAVQTDGKILIGGDFRSIDGTPKNYFARLKANGPLDFAFATIVDGDVAAIVVQPDGKILIAGSFTTVNGATRNRVARLNSDGSVDPSFLPGSGPNGKVKAMVLQPDGRILIAGSFLQVTGTARSRIARLTSIGGLDATFAIGTGFDTDVETLELDATGRVLIGGSFTTFNGTARNKIARLSATGALDAVWAPAVLGTVVYDIVIRSTGTILFAGGYYQVNGVTRRGIVEVDGTGGASVTFFAPTVNCLNATPEDAYRTVYLQGDGKVVVGGNFYFCSPGATGFGGPEFPFGLMRYNINGSWDNTYLPMAGSGWKSFHGVMCMAPTVDGHLFIGGLDIQNITGGNGYAKVQATGAHDPTFRPSGMGFDDRVNAIALRDDGAIFVGGRFGAVNGTSRKQLALLTPNGDLNMGFDPGPFYSPAPNFYCIDVAAVTDLVVQPGGLVLTTSTESGNRLKRRTATGANDAAFSDPDESCFAMYQDLVARPDGKIMIAGRHEIGWAPVHRLNANGTIDPTFSIPVLDRTFDPMRIAVMADGRTLYAGRVYDGHTTPTVDEGTNVLRFLSSGATDPAYIMTVYTGGTVNALVLQPDGKAVIAGSFTHVGGVPRAGIARLRVNGTLDTSFDPGTGLNGPAHALALRNDGKILVGGQFTTCNGIASKWLVQLHGIGVVDASFDVGNKFAYYDALDAAAGVYALAMQTDGRVIVGGQFTSYNGVGRNRLLRLGNGVSVTLPIRAFLQGPYDPLNYNMTDYLRGGGLIPMQSPYGASETLDPAMLGQLGNASVVDWVHVEVRDAADATEILAARNLLVRKDGYIMELNGTTPKFALSPGPYYVSVHHRNHLAVMTAQPVVLNGNTLVIDFTLPSTLVYGNDPQRDENGVMLMWAGNTNGDGSLRYTGLNNDRDPILVAIGGVVATNTTTGYVPEDVNLDGVVKYVGAGNDRDPILFAIGGAVATAVREEQLP